MAKWIEGRSRKVPSPKTHVGMTPVKSVLAEYRHHARSLRPDIDRIHRAESRKDGRILNLISELFADKIVVPEYVRGGYEGFKERYKNVKPRHVMPAKGHQIPEERDPTPPRTRVLLQLDLFKVKWQGDFRQGYDEFKRVTLVDDPIEAYYMFFSGRLYFIVKDDYLEQTLSRTVLYNNRALLLRNFNDKRLKWASVVSYIPA